MRRSHLHPGSRGPAWALLVAALVGSAIACERPDLARMRSTVAERSAQFSEHLAHPDSASANAPLAKWNLPSSLNEISGLALTGNGMVLAHDDNLGRVSVIDPRGGMIVKRFMLGDQATLADFEGIAMARGMLYLLASNGALYEFREGADGARVRYVVLDTRLGHECEFEGLEYDPRRRELLMPCKTVHLKHLKDDLVIYRLHLGSDVTPVLSRLVVPLAQVVRGQEWKEFHPSAITIDPKTGTYVIVAGREHALVGLSPEGDVLWARDLPGRHPQAEGVAITHDGVLILSDEATTGSATLTLYRWPLAAGESP